MNNLRKQTYCCWRILHPVRLTRCLTTSVRCLDKLEAKAEFSNGRILKIETGEYARMADGAAIATLGDTSVLITAVSKSRGGPSPGFMPLTVDYRQKYAAAGRIPTNYIRREMGQTDKEILTSRVIDRSVRPLFPEGYHFDTQLSCQLLAVDSMHDPDVVSINAASAALAVSDIPWGGPVGAVRVGFAEGEVLINPTRRELSHSDLNLVVAAAPRNTVVMLEGGGNIVLQQNLMNAIKTGVKECQHVIRAIEQLAKLSGRKKRDYTNCLQVQDDTISAAKTLSETRLRSIFTDSSHDKISRDNAVNSLRTDVVKTLTEDGVDFSEANLAFSRVCKSVFREIILDEETRCDGRGLKDLRPVNCKVNLFKPLHGSSSFQRGQTQVQCTLALDAPDYIEKLDPLLQATGDVRSRNFRLHYTFPSFATNELGRSGILSRREVGHGALAERALRPLIPSSIPFAVLLTATVLESNGSSSMATVCGGSLALMDAGIKITAPAAGVAIGLVTRHDDCEDHKILTDISGIEDYMGDMDFKIAGTSKGVTALQVDVKLPGVPLKVIMSAVQQGSEAKSSVLSIMNATMPSPRQEQNDNMPVVEELKIPVHKKGRLIGPGGTTKKRIEADVGVQLSWQGEDTLSIFAPNQAAMDEARDLLDEILVDNEPTLEFGGIYTATVREVREQGVMVTLYENMTPTLIHVSQLDLRKINHPSALGLEVGQELKVKYFGRDPATGKMRLSRRALQATIKF